MSNNKIILEDCIKQFKDENEITLNNSVIFEHFALLQIFKDNNISYENIINSIVDGGNDGGIDSIMLFINDEIIEGVDELQDFEFKNKTHSHFSITQTKKENSFKESTIDKLITTIPIILDLEKNEDSLLSRFNSDLVNQVLLLIEIWKKTAINGGSISIDYNYITNATEIQVNDVFKQKSEQLKELTKKAVSTENIYFKLYGCSELLELFQKQKPNRLSIEFKDRPITIEYNNGIGYVGTVSLSSYKNFITSESESIRDDLFESNIRHFQGLVDVNKKIKASVETATNEDFWWLNNGITIIAEDPKEVGKKLSIENVQIVNGLQTSFSIFDNLIEEDENRSVLVKIIINSDKEITDNIIAATNSQNPVSPTLLRATEPIHRNIELYFSNKGYYYDRRKNYYKNQGKPSTKIFGIKFTAQSIETIIFGNPHTARSSPTSLLKKDPNYSRIFNDNTDFKAYLNCCLINKKVHSSWLHLDDAELKNRISNFKLHLARFILNLLYEKSDISIQEIIDTDVDALEDEVFKNTVNFLDENINTYLSENENKNLINIAKSSNFTTYLNNRITEQYGS